MNPSNIGDKKISRFREILPQVIASTIKNGLIVGFGAVLALPSIVIPALTGFQNEHNQNEYLSITAEQSSWLGSNNYLLQPLGSLLSALITDPLGRKNSMILVNIPIGIGWFLLWKGDALWKIYTGISLIGFGCGLLESPVITYVGEITQPSIRGVLMAYTNVTGTLGMLLVFFLNNLMPWRSVALFCFFIPIITAIAICFIPETPQWLLSKSRTNEAQKSLCWLRGWVSTETISQEFNDLQRHSDRANSCNPCEKQDLKCTHPLPTLVEKYRELKRRRNMKPFIIVMTLFVITQFSGMLSIRPFIVQIFEAYESPFSSDKTSTIMSLLDNIVNIMFACLVRFVGKRRFYLYLLLGAAISSGVISFYGFIYLPQGYVSFDHKFETFHQENQYLSYIPIICLFLWSFVSYMGIIAIPWMLLSEIFPFKSRAIVTGIAAALCNIIGFLTRKTYYSLEMTLSLPGASLFYCLINIFGLVISYFILPETENKTLEDIELHFSDNSKKITDRNIIKTSSKKKDVETSTERY